ncbi:hypothetical protein R5R35_013236 [Gryllus longicercus]|uniref:Angiotensin-converting enzyme n=1 Tax=Gryllus longicercus TaxID=2509291 RepID=A0AAN9ZIL7_9ORTH
MAHAKVCARWQPFSGAAWAATVLLLAAAGGLADTTLQSSDDTPPTPTPTPTAQRADLQQLEQQARAFLQQYDREAARRLNDYELAAWAYDSNLTAHNQQQKLKASAALAAFTKEQWRRATAFPWQEFSDPDTRRQLKELSVLGAAALPPPRYDQLQKIIADMQTVYSKAKICDYRNKTKCDLSLEPDLVNILTHSRDAGELRHVWVEWRRASGEKVRDIFNEYVAISNEAAALNNFTDNSEMWLEAYETPNFREDLQRLWEQMRPLYQQLHAYVRRHLRMRYGDAEVTQQGPIPAHLLGNMWAQSWEAVFPFSKPYPDAQDTDATPKMLEQGYTPERMFKLSEQFFTSLNLSAMPESFWERSILEKPKDREIVCHASAWDFYDGKDFRIKQCTRVNMRDLFVAHHEMGHIQYDLQYKDQPVLYRGGANPGFHEAIGDVMALSVSTPKHLRRVGLLDGSEADDSPETALNFLYLQALQKVGYLPFGYIVDLWRWDVFKGWTTPDEYNCQWWRLRELYQGVEPPVDRSEDNFDPAAKYHVVASVPYIRYFVSTVIQFQIHRALCIEAGQFDPTDDKKPLHNCDIYESAAAGNKLKAMLRLGSSRPWPEALEAVTGSRHMDASGLLDYFRPLAQWLEEENRRTGQIPGWDRSKKNCVSGQEELYTQRADETTVPTGTTRSPTPQAL